MSLRLVLLGPPGSGKGTLASMIADRLAIRHMSTGEIFRRQIADQTALGKAVSSYVVAGRFVPDELAVEVMRHRLTRCILGRGFVLDGFPRTVGQADGLERFLKRQRFPLVGALYLVLPSSELIARLSGRRVCKRCGAIYHIRNMPPKRSGLCDRCGGGLVIREDDRVATIKRRLILDRAKARPLLDYYRRRKLLYRLNAGGSNAEVFQRAVRIFRRNGWLSAGFKTSGNSEFGVWNAELPTDHSAF